MAGLMESVMSAGAPQAQPLGGQPPAQPGVQPGAQPGAGQDGEPATEEEQSAFDRAMVAVGRMLYDKDGLKTYARTIGKAKNPAQAMGRAALDVLRMVDEKSGGEIPETMLVPIATETLGLIAEGVEAAGVKVDGKMIAAAAKHMIDDFMAENGASPEEVEQFSSMVDIDSMGGGIDQVLGERQ